MFMMQPVKTPSHTEHFPYDVCNCKSCLEEADKVEYDEDVPKKKKESQKSLKKRHEAGDPSVGLLGEPSGKFDYYVLYAEFPALTTFENPQQKTKHSWKIQNSNVMGPAGSPNQITAAEATLNWQSENVVAQNNDGLVEVKFKKQDRRDVLSTMFMMQPVKTPSHTEHFPYDVCNCKSCLEEADKYQAEFPALTTFENPQQKTKHSWKIQNSNVMGPTGSPNQITAAEATLNWQSENIVAQNNVLKTILAQQSRFNMTQEALVDRVQSLENFIYEV
ncbi:hypothetical protein L1987_23944 [Smallanthus sonchifolius]|uniref:Uncharacterized protein n=1 Tax=Smallanthus sonchifolius TaxID=185202 RepID=A0ACB9IJ26_9ASTR|nr:hypothetical protein L1987_23944 [Smallanthus sonchifolius]